MRIQPILYLDHLTEEELSENECSDRIWLSKSEFEHWVTTAEVGVVTLLQITNSVQQSAIGFPHCIHHNDPDIVYVPSWMYARLEADETISLSRFQPSMCTGIVLQPHTSDHLTFSDPEISLRNAFEKYACLTPGTDIPLWIGYPFQVTIAALQPTEEPLCIRNCELSLELMPPLDAPLQESLKPVVEQPKADERNTVVYTEEEKEPDQGIRLGGSVSHMSRRELAAAAALRRAQKN